MPNKLLASNAKVTYKMWIKLMKKGKNRTKKVGCRKDDWCRNLRGDIVMKKTRENMEQIKRESLAAVHALVVLMNK